MGSGRVVRVLVTGGIVESVCCVPFQDSSKTSRKVSDKWALPLNKRVRVSACKRHMPDTRVFVPTYHQAFLPDYRKPNKLAAEHLRPVT